ncbi:MAG: GGDEF domain-containing protein [Pirellulaceae bacterium]
MVAIILAIGVVNFAIGLALAMWLQGALVLPGPIWSWYGRSARPEVLSGTPAATAPPEEAAAKALSQAASLKEASEPESVGASPCEVPGEWATMFAGEGLQPATLLEALLWVARLELPSYREQLVLGDQCFQASQDAELPRDQLRDANETWSRKLSNWAATLASKKDDTSHPELRKQLEELLLDQSYQIKSVSDRIDSIRERSDRPGRRQSLLVETCSLFDAVNSLRDALDSALAQLLRTESRLGTLPESLHAESNSETYSRLGLDVLFDQWWSNDPDRVRLVSCVLVDVDRVAKLNERLGARGGDNTIAAFGTLLRELVRQERGFDHVARFCGQSYLLFLGDTAGTNAVSGAERIRQTIEAASFQIGEESIELTVSCAVAEIGRQETLPEFFARLKKALKEAKKAGRNRTGVSERNTTKVVQLPQYKVKGRVIEVVDAF